MCACVCMCVCKYVYVYIVCTYVCVCTYIHTTWDIVLDDAVLGNDVGDGDGDELGLYQRVHTRLQPVHACVYMRV